MKSLIAKPTFPTLPAIRIAQLIRSDVLATALFLVGSLVFIAQTSFIAMDGQRYFSLFEDGMISMRYAWNLSHGLGLVWNAGEHVEGYTNLLMTLVMAVATALFDKSTAVLAIQILGIPTVLGVAILTRKLAALLYPGNIPLANIAFVGVLFYLPLVYWSLVGMETGLLTLLILAGCLYAFRAQIHLAALFLGLAFLTRNESILLAGLVFGYLAYKQWHRGGKLADALPLLFALALYGAFVAGQLLFRLWYYGQLVPNTYILKVTGVPLSLKLRWGLSYVWPFVLQSWPLFGLALVAVLRDRFKNALLILFPAILLAYQVSVGGDAFPLWRILAPGMPFLFILAAAALTRFASVLRVPRTLPWVLLILNLELLSLPLLPQIYSNDGQTFLAVYNKHSVDLALGLNAVTSQEASIGVFLAGATPYYTDRKAIDFLGKADAYIASLPAHLNIAMPGHNKFDLGYSIKKLQPTYIQRFYWWDKKENLRPWAIRHYVRANYATPYGDITLILKRNDPSVRWDKLTIIPWAEEK